MLVQLFILKKIEINIYYNNLSYFNYFLIENSENNIIFEHGIYTLNLKNANPLDYFLIFSLKRRKVLVVDIYQLSSKFKELNFKTTQEKDIKKSLQSISILNEDYIFHTLSSSLNTKTISFSKFLKIPLYNKK